MSVDYLDELTDCLVCGGQLGGAGTGRGLCGTCYRREYKAGTVERFGLRPTRHREETVGPDGAVPHAFPLFVPMPWTEHALCAEVDHDIFFPEKGGSTREAKGICGACLVRAECLDYALETRQRFGIWGGCSERERRKLLGLAEDDAEEASAA